MDATDIPTIPSGFRVLAPRDLKQIGDLFWGGKNWIECRAVGESVGFLNIVIRGSNKKVVPVLSSKEKVEKYLLGQKKT